MATKSSRSRRLRPAEPASAAASPEHSDGGLAEPCLALVTLPSHPLPLPSPPMEVKHYVGHRERLRARANEHGFLSLAAYEQLELILFQALPRQDVKPLAKALLQRFGSLLGVLTASRAELSRFPLIKESVLHLFQLFQDVAVLLAQQDVKGRDIIASWEKVVQYCQLKLQHKTIEEFHVLFLDRKNGLLADEVQQTGTVDQAPVYPREVVKRALELGASAMILVHNHPSGDPTPSRADILITKKIIEAAAPLDIVVHDHVIVGRGGHTSLRAAGLVTFR